MTTTPTTQTATLESTLTVDAQAWSTMHADRDAGHRMIMGLWDHLPRSADKGPRSTSSILWHPTSLDPERGTGQIVVRSTRRPGRLPFWLRDLNIEDSQAPSGSLTLQVSLVATYTPMSTEVTEPMRAVLKAGADGTARRPGEGLAYRRDPVRVPDERLDDWVRSKLTRNGFKVDSADVLGQSVISLRRRGGGLPVTTFRLIGEVVDQAAFTSAWHGGIGRGRSFGVGMLRNAN